MNVSVSLSAVALIAMLAGNGANAASPALLDQKPARASSRRTFSPSTLLRAALRKRWNAASQSVQKMVAAEL